MSDGEPRGGRLMQQPATHPAELSYGRRPWELDIELGGGRRPLGLIATYPEPSAVVAGRPTDRPANYCTVRRPAGGQR